MWPILGIIVVQILTDSPIITGTVTSISSVKLQVTGISLVITVIAAFLPILLQIIQSYLIKEDSSTNLIIRGILEYVLQNTRCQSLTCFLIFVATDHILAILPIITRLTSTSFPLVIAGTSTSTIAHAVRVTVQTDIVAKKIYQSFIIKDTSLSH